MRAKFQVYGDLPTGGPAFLVQNQQSASYNLGINADSGNTNSGTGLIQVFNGTTAPVLATNFPKSG